MNLSRPCKLLMGKVVTAAIALLLLESGGGISRTFASDNAEAFVFRKLGGEAQPPLNGPNGIALDGKGNLYVADWYGASIHMIDTNGVATVVAGKPGEVGFVDGPALDARFNRPSAVAVDAAGNLYITEYGNRAVRKMSGDKVVTTLAGGNYGTADGTRGEAQFIALNSVVTDGAGTLFVTDLFAGQIRRISAAGVVTTIAGRASSGTPNSTARDGVGTNAFFSEPYGLTFYTDGSLLVADGWMSHTIRKVTLDGVVTTFAGALGVGGTNNGARLDARFSDPRGITTDGKNNVYVLDGYGQMMTLRKISPEGVVTSSQMRTESGGLLVMEYAEGIKFDTADNLYIADSYGACIRKGMAAPALQILASPSSVIQFSFKTVDSKPFTLEFTDSLPSMQWVEIPFESSSQNGIISVIPKNSTGIQGYYRIRQ